MPYIRKEQRDKLISTDTRVPKDAGELNFVITILLQQYFIANGGRYQQINDIIGAIEGAKLEFTRRVTNPYEDVKINENGDVFHQQIRGNENGNK